MSYFDERMAEIEAESDLKRRIGKPRSRAMRYVVVETTRHGQRVHYYRRGKGPRVRLPNPDVVGYEAFNQAYQAAARDKPIGFREIKPQMCRARKPHGVVGFVYFVQVGDAVKIGFAQDVKQRVSSMGTAFPESPKVLLVIPGTDATEQYFHGHFAAYRQKGEWFRLEGALAAFLAGC